MRLCRARSDHPPRAAAIGALRQAPTDQGRSYRVLADVWETGARAVWAFSAPASGPDHRPAQPLFARALEPPGPSARTQRGTPSLRGVANSLIFAFDRPGRTPPLNASASGRPPARSGQIHAPEWERPGGLG